MILCGIHVMDLICSTKYVSYHNYMLYASRTWATNFITPSIHSTYDTLSGNYLVVERKRCGFFDIFNSRFKLIQTTFQLEILKHQAQQYALCVCVCGSKITIIWSSICGIQMARTLFKMLMHGWLFECFYSNIFKIFKPMNTECCRHSLVNSNHLSIVFSPFNSNEFLQKIACICFAIKMYAFAEEMEMHLMPMGKQPQIE